MLKFDIPSSRIINGTDTEKKYVVYLMQVRHLLKYGTVDDTNPVHVERRYTHFLDLYNGLRTDFPSAVANLNFPKKVVMGNFDPDLIASRCFGFEELLEIIANDFRLRQCPSTIRFLRDVEQNEAKRLIKEYEYEFAFNLLETSFKLLNKVYTERDYVVMLALCRLIACCACGSAIEKLARPVERWATLALWRFSGVSDVDLLSLYVPLLKSCLKLWDIIGRDKTNIEKELDDLKKRGMNVDDVPTLMEAIEKLERS